MPGPAPKHPSRRARRNNARADFRVLDSKGRTGPIPAWPLHPAPSQVAELELMRDRVATLQVELDGAEDGRTKGRLRQHLSKAELAVATLELQIEQTRDAEVELWEQLWRTPQAVIWEESKAEREVAQYVRWKIAGEQGSLDAAKEARMLSDRLGLNPLALMRLRAEIEHAEEAAAKGERRRVAAKPAASTKQGGEDEDPRAILRAVK